MPLLPYCVFLSDSIELPKTGVRDRDLLRLDVPGLSVIYSDLAAGEIVGDQFQAAALQFHDVVRAVFERRAVIPFRFPTFLTKEELREHVTKESEEYLNFLSKHSEDAQMEVRLWRVDTAQAKPSSGTEYMMRLSEHLMLLQSAAHDVQGISGHVVRAWKSDESREAIRLFALMQRRDIHEFREKLTNAVHRANIGMRVTGPWPATEFFPGSATRVPRNVVSIAGGDKP
jgi:hypothetical protein